MSQFMLLAKLPRGGGLDQKYWDRDLCPSPALSAGVRGRSIGTKLHSVVSYSYHIALYSKVAGLRESGTVVLGRSSELMVQGVWVRTKAAGGR